MMDDDNNNYRPFPSTVDNDHGEDFHRRGDGLFRTSGTGASPPAAEAEAEATKGGEEDHMPATKISLFSSFMSCSNLDSVFTPAHDLGRQRTHGGSTRSESLLTSNSTTKKIRQQRARIAASFLKDYEEGRSPSFRRHKPATNSNGSNSDSDISRTITDRKVQIYWFKNLNGWRIWGLGVATVSLFLGHVPSHSILTLMLHLYSWTVFGVDWYMAREMSNDNTISRENPEPIINSGDEDGNKDNPPDGSDDIFRLDTSMSFSSVWSSSSSLSISSQTCHADDGRRRPKNHTGSRRTEDFINSRGMAIFLLMFFIEIWTVFFFSSRVDDRDRGGGNDNQEISPPPFLYQTIVTITGISKPIVLFYMNRKARDALQALIRVIQKLARVIIVELFLILVFAAVACRLYSSSSSSSQVDGYNSQDGGRLLEEQHYQHQYDYSDDQQEDYYDRPFETLAKSWLSMFALSTTVVNPGLWMPVYNESRWNALFFALFIVVAIFYLHSLVLSVIFQVFVQSAQAVHKQSSSDQEACMRMAFLTLLDDGSLHPAAPSREVKRNNRLLRVDPELFYEIFRLLRPHYGKLKLKVLMDMIILDHAHNTSEPPWHGQNEDESCSNQSRDGTQARKDSAAPSKPNQFLEYYEFRMRVSECLNSSIRISRRHSNVGMSIEVLSAIVATVNFAYVVLLTSKFEVYWFVQSEFVVGSILTLLSLLEVLMRYNPLKLQHYPFTRLNAVLDGCALLGALISLSGIGACLADHVRGLTILFTGRAISMIQCLRFSVWGREVLQRSIRVLPAMVGPVLLVITTMHIFVCIGMLLWQGTVDPNEMLQNENVEYLFWNNNFNSYTEGVVTILNVMVINDWHQIANVFLYASRCSSPIVVYGFFVSVVILAVSVMLNLIVVFFCETFVSQLNLVDAGDTGTAGSGITSSRTSGEDLMTGKLTPLAASFVSSLHFDSNDLKRKGITTTVCDDTNQDIQFDIIHKERYDELMKAVANTTDRQNEELAINLRNTLELLSPAGNGVGYMIYVNRSCSQFSTKSFKTIVKDYMRENELYNLISEATESFGFHDDFAMSVSTPFATPQRRTSFIRSRSVQQIPEFRRIFKIDARSMLSSLEVTSRLVPDKQHLILFTAKRVDQQL